MVAHRFERPVGFRLLRAQAPDRRLCGLRLLADVGKLPFHRHAVVEKPLELFVPSRCPGGEVGDLRLDGGAALAPLAGLLD